MSEKEANKGEETFDEIKYLLGNMGIEILFAIDRGAKIIETIKLFSGIPIRCVKGRLPVLLELSLIKREKDEYFLTDKGNILKTMLKNANL
ncbi:MAG: hypothetical protein GF353_13615 [Candidatus Lokiarchaeota archaeon]|nr:hypothetical protein [Candidatus Lokiarchaeota archaeon]